MRKFNNGIFDSFSGRVGNVVGATGAESMYIENAQEGNLTEQLPQISLNNGLTLQR